MKDSVKLPQTRIEPIHQSLYPEKDDLEPIAEDILERAPKESRNEVFAFLMTYHNSLINLLKKLKEIQ